MQAYDGDVPAALIHTMFDFGRYLLISSSRSGGWPANLQGIWNGDYAPAWNCDIHTDENIQMNYWPALPGGLQKRCFRCLTISRPILTISRRTPGIILVAAAFRCRLL